MAAFIDIIYPKICLLCEIKLPENNVDNFICRDCWDKIERRKPPFCRQCGRTLESKELKVSICAGCARIRSSYEQAYSCLRYDGNARELIHLFKYSGLTGLRGTFCRMLIEQARQYGIPVEKADFLIPIPLHAVKFREREFNQARLLAEGLSEEFQVKIFDGLKRLRPTGPQADKEAAERFTNVRGCFTVENPEKIKGKRVFLIDDIMTTQATLQEASRALKNAGCLQINVYTLAN